MSEVIFGRIFSKPLHWQGWIRPAGNTDYRVTNTFDGEDLLNGGKHRAVDAGNFDDGDPLYAPVACQARGLRHFDGALGVEFDLGHGWTLELWHLDRVDLPTTWTAVAAGRQVGLTGNSGARLPNGAEMPKHTHIALKLNGVPVNPEPHLFGVPLTLVEDDEMLPDFTPIATGVIGAGNRLRKEPSLSSDPYELGATDTFDIVGIEPNGSRYSLDGGKTFRTDWLAVRRTELRWCARALVTDIKPTDVGLALLALPAADCSALENQIAGARTAVAGARRAIDAAASTLAQQ